LKLQQQHQQHEQQRVTATSIATDCNVQGQSWHAATQLASNLPYFCLCFVCIFLVVMAAVNRLPLPTAAAAAALLIQCIIRKSNSS